MRFIYDLDHTVICSKHRSATLPDGSLDLNHWREHSTPELIAKDKLLPLAGHWKTQRSRGCEIDFRFLDENELYFHGIISRAEGDTSPDAILKERGLRNYAFSSGYSWARFCKFSIMLDDNESVIKHLTARGLRVYNSLEINARAVA
jgi:hypothetical protein